MFTGNASPEGGAIEIESEPAASTISGSTFSDNSATGTVGGAIENMVQGVRLASDMASRLEGEEDME